MRRRSLIAGGFIGAACAGVHAQFQPSLVADLRTTLVPNSSVYESTPLFAASTGGLAIFSATDSQRGREFWVTNGTPFGTRLLADFGPRTLEAVADLRSQVPVGTFAPVQRGPQDSFLLWTTMDARGRLWRWRDGDARPTLLLQGQGGSAEFQPSTFFGALASDRFFFVVRTGAGNYELRVTDGIAGTQLVQSFPTTADIQSLSAAGTRVHFMCTQPNTGTDPWVSDGTAQGTFMLLDIPGAGTVPGARFAPLGNLAYFVASASGSGLELWVTDGTTQGTALAADLSPGSGGSGIDALVSSQTGVYFNAPTASSTGIYRVTAPGAAPVRITSQVATDSAPGVSSLVPSGNLIFYITAGRVLARIDGTTGGTLNLPGPAFYQETTLPILIPFITSTGSARVFFRASTTTTGLEPWVSDGTALGTFRLRDVAVGPGDSVPSPLVAVGGGALFSVIDAGIGREPWFTDGTAAGTAVLRDIHQVAQGSAPRELLTVDGRLHWSSGSDNFGIERWRTDGAHAQMCQETIPGPSSFTNEGFAAVDQRVFSRSRESTPGGTMYRVRASSSACGIGEVVADISTSTSAYLTGSFSQTAAACVFLGLAPGRTNTWDSCLWRSDGTPQGTAPISPLAPGTPADIQGITSVGSVAFVFAYVAPNRARAGIFQTDGMNVNLLQDIGTSVGTPVTVPLGNRVFALSGPLFVLSPSAGPNYSVSQLTPAGGIGNASFAGLAAVNGRVIFGRYESATGYEPWSSEGTVATTARIVDLAPGTVDSRPMSLVTALDSHGEPAVYFSAYHPDFGRELWMTDGTAAGTSLVADIWPGPAGSNPDLLTAVDGRLFFTANRGDTGYELWTSDGTAAGTMLVDDLVPGPDSPGITFLKASGGRLYFDPALPDIGRELWTVYVSGRYCDADFNADGEVNADDLGDFITCYFASPPCPDSEFNADGNINADDLGDFITRFFDGC